MSACIKLSILLFFVIDTKGQECKYSDDTCEFHLTVEHKLTMMDYKTLVVPSKGKLYKFDVQDISNASPIPAEMVITADGHIESRVITAVNGQFPGPPIIVYEGQTVIIHVTNNLTSDGTTIHWHGLPQRGTPWMDGVAYITQCPIMPGQTFTYSFTAEPTGTYWYHSHIGVQRSMGLNGAFIIRERKQVQMEEHIMMIQDYNHEWDSELMRLKILYANFRHGKEQPLTKSIEGSYFKGFVFQSGLINGRGRYYNPETGTHNGAPLSVFKVRRGMQYRFRMIGSGAFYPFRVSIDNHNLTVIASDGHDLEPVIVDSIIINSGERYDFILTTDKSVSNYWIRAETLERDVHHRTEAILRYDGAPEEEPVSDDLYCSNSYKCKVLNCPFSFYPPSYNFVCINFDKLKTKRNDDPAVMSHADSNNIPRFPTFGGRDPRSDLNGLDEEYFLNVAIPGIAWPVPSINGIKFKAPFVSALTQSSEVESDYHCANYYCNEDEVCECFHTLTIERNKTVQIVFLNMGLGKRNEGAHPIHMHGYSFQVLKIGYGQYDSKGQLIGDNLDIDCHGNPNRSMSFCNKATWSRSNWGGNNVPGLELKKPSRKDTIMVPSGGYVVVRIKADNPGLWFLHCHMEDHNNAGMAMALNVSLRFVPDPPSGFPRCGNFPPSRDVKRRSVHRRGVGKEPLQYPEDSNHFEIFKGSEIFNAWLLFGTLWTIIVLQGIIIGTMLSRKKKVNQQ